MQLRPCIVRRPRGLVAAAIQYGHVHVQMTLGYSTYDSGFADEHAYEEWLCRLERIAGDQERLANPLLQIYPGRAMTCVLDPTRALCQIFRAENDARRTPDQDDCRPSCQNIAHTDRDISALQGRAAELRNLTSDGYFAPSIRSQRERAERVPARSRAPGMPSPGRVQR